MSKAKTDPMDRLDPETQAAIRLRQACDEAWARLKTATATWGCEWDYVDQIEQRARILVPGGAVVKVWRHGDAFRIALGSTLIGTLAPDKLLEGAQMVVRR